MTHYPEAPPSISPSLPYPPLAVVVAQEAAAPDPSGSSLHLDCSAQPYHRTLGVCHQVSLLLLLRQAGFCISLHRATPVLRRCLQQLQLARLFTWVE